VCTLASPLIPIPGVALQALPNLPARNTVHEERVLSLIAAAALWSGITSNATLLNSSCVVLRAAERRRRPGNG
jgi:hypothetical protein